MQDHVVAFGHGATMTTMVEVTGDLLHGSQGVQGAGTGEFVGLLRDFGADLAGLRQRAVGE